MSCFAAFHVDDTTLFCHRPSGHDGRHRAELTSVATVHWSVDDGVHNETHSADEAVPE